MITGFGVLRAAIYGCLCFALLGSAATTAQPTPSDDGLRIYKSANCVGCHKWSGTGGGGYGGAAANLRETKLSLDQIEETIRCGRPMAGMPHFQLDAYSDGSCYGLKASDLPDGKMPPEPDHGLRPADIKAVAVYVVTHIKDKGDPTFSQCQAFFGTGTRVCDVYAKKDDGGGQDVSQSGPGKPSPHGHLKVDAASDLNAASNGPGK